MNEIKSRTCSATKKNKKKNNNNLYTHLTGHSLTSAAHTSA